MNTKICGTCKIEKELSSFYSTVDKRNGKDYTFSTCRSCCIIRDREWKRSHPEKTKEIQHRNQKNNGHHFSESRRKKWKSNWIENSQQRKVWDKAKNRERNELASKLCIEQKNKCAICHQDFSISGRYDVDHSHATGLVRGLLCRKCNSGLHYFEDKEFIRKAEDYLASYPALKYPSTKY